MKELDKILTEMQKLLVLKEQLEETYKNRNRGEIYRSRVIYLTTKAKYLENKLLQLGGGKITQFIVIGIGKEGISKTYNIWFQSEIDMETVRKLVSIKYPEIEILDVKAIAYLELGQLRIQYENK